MLEPEVVTMHPTSAPEGLPVLSRGKHRTPRKGACFMEMASVLAGERWSDHPSCTHPLLGYLARLVNDETSDRHRGDLATLIPSVVGVRGGSIAWTIAVSSAVAGRAVTQVPEPTQRVLAAGLFRAEQLADDHVVQRDIRAALQSVPGAVAWVHQFATPGPVTPAQFTRHSAPTMVRCSVQGLVAAGDSEQGRDPAGPARGRGGCRAQPRAGGTHRPRSRRSGTSAQDDAAGDGGPCRADPDRRGNGVARVRAAGHAQASAASPGVVHGDTARVTYW